MKSERIQQDRISLMIAELQREDIPSPRKAALLKSFRQQMPEAEDAIDKVLIEQTSGLHAALTEASQHLEKLRERINDLVAPPFFPARCLAVAETPRGREAYVICNGQSRMVLVDEDVPAFEIGTEVLLSQTMNRVLAITPASPPNYGETALLERVLDNGSLLVSSRGESRTVVASRELRAHPPKAGASVQLDPGGVIAEREVCGSETDEYLVTTVPTVTFDDIGGLDDEIRRIRELILLHTQHGNVASRYGLPRSNAILLAGRMGSGKTMLAQATCRFLGELAGTAKGRWLYVSPGDLKDMYYGNTEKKIKRLFGAAGAAAKRDPSPLIVFFDELDSYLSKRGGSELHRVHNEVTAALLAEMDGFQRHANVWLMGATNRLDALDPAAVRASRFGDNIITFGAPRRSGTREIFRKHLSDTIPVVDGNPDDLIESVTALLYAPNADNKIADIQFRDGTRRAVTAKDMISGAEISKICRLAKERAALREIEGGEPGGLSLQDLQTGVERFIQESGAKLKPHNIGDYIDDLPQDLDVVKVEPMRRPKSFQKVRAA